MRFAAGRTVLHPAALTADSQARHSVHLSQVFGTRRPQPPVAPLQNGKPRENLLKTHLSRLWSQVQHNHCECTDDQCSNRTVAASVLFCGSSCITWRSQSLRSRMFHCPRSRSCISRRTVIAYMWFILYQKITFHNVLLPAHKIVNLVAEQTFHAIRREAKKKKTIEHLPWSQRSIDSA